MNRLRDESGWDSLSERGIELLRRVPASYSRSDLKRRVWAEVQEICVNASVEPHHARVKAFALGIVVVASAATAGAAIGGRWIAPRVNRTFVSAATTPAEAQPHRHKGKGTIRRIADAWEPSELAAPAPATAAEPVAASSGTEMRAPTRAARHAGTPVAEGRTEVLDALVALRRDHRRQSCCRPAQSLPRREPPRGPPRRGSGAGHRGGRHPRRRHGRAPAGGPVSGRVPDRTLRTVRRSAPGPSAATP